MTEQTEIQDQSESQSNLPAVVGTLLDNLKAVISDQMPDEDAYILSIEMVNTIGEKVTQVIEDGRMMVAAALEQRDDAISLQQMAEEKAKDIVEALEDWMDTDNEEVRSAVEDIEETLSEYLYESWVENVAGDEFVETLASVLMTFSGDKPTSIHYTTAYFLYHAVDGIPDWKVTPQMVAVIEALYLKVKELADLSAEVESDEDGDEETED